MIRLGLDLLTRRFWYKFTRTFYRLVDGSEAQFLVDRICPRGLPPGLPSWRTYYFGQGRITTHRARLGPGDWPSCRATTKAAAIMAFLSSFGTVN